MKCPKCKALNAKDAEFCNLCGQPFEPKQSKTPKTEPVVEEESDKNDEKEKPVETNHASPGFGDIRKKAEKTPETNSSSKQPIAIKKSPFSFLDWLYPALLATIIAYAVIIVIPKEQISTTMGLSKVVLVSVLFGLIISAGGVVKLNARLSTTGWLLGFSGALLAFNLLFISSFVLVKLSPNLYTRLFLGSEIIIMSSILTVAIVLFWTLEKIPIKMAVISAVIFFVVSLIGSWLILKSSFNPMPIITFISWPAGYYLLKWAQTREVKTESQVQEAK